MRSFNGFLISLVGFAAACSSAAPSDPPTVGSVESALTAAECVYFDANGKDMICHATGSTTHPYTLIKISGSACEHAHASHAGDYITSADPASPLYDPTCGGGGCLPEGAPCDATLPCCDGLACSNGTCVASAPPAAPPGGAAAPPADQAAPPAAAPAAPAAPAP